MKIESTSFTPIDKTPLVFSSGMVVLIPISATKENFREMLLEIIQVHDVVMDRLTKKQIQEGV